MNMNQAAFAFQLAQVVNGVLLVGAEHGETVSSRPTTFKPETLVCSVVFTSDQGLAVGQHGLLGKQNLYDHSLRMPFIMAGPGIAKGKRNDALFNLQSLFATTCDMAGVTIPGTVEFPSIVPLITGVRPAMTDAVYAAFLDRQRAIRTRDWKLIITPHAGKTQLFHVKHDPWETRDLATNPRYTRVMAELKQHLRGLMREMHDPMSEDRVFGAAR